MEQQEHTTVRRGDVIHCEDPRGVASAIVRVMKEIERIPKTGWNDYHNYPYSTESDVMETVRPLCAKYGLAIVPSVVDRQVDVVDTNRGTANRAEVAIDVYMIDEETGGVLATRWFGEAIDSGDKAIYKAYTGALKYWAQKTFLMSSEDDPERDSHETTGAPRKRSRENGGSKYDPLGLDDEMPFGKHRGKTIQWIVDNHLDYMVWLVGEKDDFELTDEARDYANQAVKSQQQKVRHLQESIEDAQTENGSDE